MIKSECYCTNLRRSANIVSDFYDHALKETRLTIAQYRLLRNLERLQCANITHWAEAVGLDRSTMVRNIKVLELANLVKKTEGHGKTYTLSAYGQQILETAVPIWQTANEKLEHFLGKEDAQAILRIESKLQMLGGEKNV